MSLPKPLRGLRDILGRKIELVVRHLRIIKFKTRAEIERSHTATCPCMAPDGSSAMLLLLLLLLTVRILVH